MDPTMDPAADAKKRARAARFQQHLQTPKDRKPVQKSQFDHSDSISNLVSDVNNLRVCDYVVGTSSEVRKPYLRLTEKPDPSTIRPLPVLRQALEMVSRDWDDNRDYNFACSQLKSIRQDLTVQHIRDDFSVHVYELHTRLAMIQNDHSEFNQCQTQLKLLYEEGFCDGNRSEFTGYRILYYIFTGNWHNLTALHCSLSNEDRKEETISHALLVLQAWTISDYYRIFKLYKNSPKMSAHIMDWFIERERKKAMNAILKAYRPHIHVDFLRKTLGYWSIIHTDEFLDNFNVVRTLEGHVDCKRTLDFNTR